jgi:hypothetical protein
VGAQFQTLFMLLRREIRYNHVRSCWLAASSGLLSHSSYCLLNAHVTALCKSRSNPEKALCESRFHLIVLRYFQVKSTLGIHPIRLVILVR